MAHVPGHGINPPVTPVQRAIAAARQFDPADSSAIRPRFNEETRLQAEREIAERDRRRRRDRSRSVGEFAGDTLLSGLGGAVDLSAAGYGIGNILTGGFLDEVTGGFSENFRRTQQFLDEAQSEPLRLRREDAFRAFEEEGVGAGIGEFLENPSLILDVATQAAPSLIPAVGAGQLAARTAGAVGGRLAAEKAAKKAVLRTVGAQTAGATNVEAVNTLREQGVGQAGRQLGGIGAGALAGVVAPGISRVTGAAGLEARAGSRLAGLTAGTGTVGAVARGAGAGAIREGVEEGAQGAAEQIAVNVVAPENDFFTQTGRAAAMGVIAGTPLGTVLGAGGAVGAERSQPAGTREQEEQRVATQEQQQSAAGSVAEAINAYNAAQREGRPLSEVVDPETGDRFKAFNPSTGEVEEVTEESFLTAQEVVARQLFNVTEDEQGNEVFSRFDPDIQSVVQVPREEALQAASEFMEEEARTVAEGQQLELDIPPGTEPAPGSVAPVDEDTGQVDLFAGQGLPRARGVDPERAPTASVPTTPLVSTTTTQEQINRTTGVTREPAQSRGDLVTERDQVLQELFRVEQDENGQQVFQRVNRDLQRLETVPREQAVREANAIIEARKEARRQEQRPLSEKWRDAFSEQLGIKKQKVKGKTFNAIVQRAQEEGVSPQDENADAFLRQEALNFVPDEASATDFESQFSETFTPQSTAELPGREAEAAPGVNDPELLNFRSFVEGGRIDRATKPQLQEVARERGVKVTGSKQELKDRLRENLNDTLTSVDRSRAEEGADQLARDVREGRREAPTPVTAQDRQRELSLPERMLDDMVRNGSIERVNKSVLTELASELQLPTSGTKDQVKQRLLDAQSTRVRAEIERLSGRAPAQDTEQQAAVPPSTTEDKFFGSRPPGKSAIRVEGQNPIYTVERGGRLWASTSVDTQGAGRRWYAVPYNTEDSQQAVQERLDRSITAPALEPDPEAVAASSREDLGANIDAVVAEPQEATTTEAATGQEVEQELPDSVQEAADQLTTEDEVPILSDEELAGLQENLFEEVNAEVRSRGLNRRETAIEKVFMDTMNNAPSFNALESNFQAIIRMEDFAGRLSKKQQEAVVKAYSDAYDKLAPNRFLRTSPDGSGFVDYRTKAQKEEDEAAGVEQFDGPIPTRGGRTPVQESVEEQTPLARERVQPIIDAVTEGDTGTVTVFNTVAEYREATNQPAPPDAAGVYNPGGGVSVILENINTEEKLAEVLAHERGHRGLEQLLGDRLPAVTNRLWANSAVRARIREKMRVEELDRARAAEEVLVDMLVHGERLNGDVASKIRSGVESFFQTALGVGKYRIPDAQINRLLQDTGNYLRVGNDDTAFGQSALTTEDTLPVDEFLGSPEAITGTPRFSRVYERLAQTVPQANPEGDNTNTFSAVGREAVEASAFRLRDFGLSIKNGRMAREFNRFLPLNQIFNLHGRKFERTTTMEDGTVTTDNPLRDARDLNDRQESAYIKRLTQKRKLELFGETFEDSAHDISGQLDALQRSNPEAATSLNQVLQFGTFYQVWPQKSFEEQSEVDLETSNFTAEERRNAHTQVQRLYNGMGDEARTLYKKVQASYRDIWEAQIDALETELKRVNGGELPNQTLALTLARRRLDTGPYSPLVRHGNFTVTVRTPEGDVVYGSAWDTESEARHVQSRIIQDYPASEGYVHSVSEARQGEFRRDFLTQGQIREVESIIENEIPANTPEDVRVALRNALIDTYMKSVPDASFRNFSQKRQNIDGFSMDGIRAFADYTNKASRQIAGIQFNGEIASAYGRIEEVIKEREREGQDTVAERQIQRHLDSQFKARINMDFNALASFTSGAGFMYMMTSPSQLFVNASQTAIVTFPRLAAQYGAADTLRIGRAALANYFKAGRDFLNEGAVEGGFISPAARQILQNRFEEGDLDFTLTNDIIDVANGSSGQLNSSWRKTLLFFSSFIHKSEVFNRQIAAVMTAELEMANRGIDPNQELTQEQIEAIGPITKDAVHSTQFNYSKSNKPPVMQGPIRQLVFQFQQFRLHMLAMYAKDIRDAAGWGDATPEDKALARRALAYMTGAQLAFTGASGVAFAPIVFGVMDAFADDDEDFVDSRTAFVEAVPTLLSHGLLGGGLNLDPGRMNMGGIIPLLGDLEYAPTTDDPTDTAAYMLERNIGPWWGLLTDMIGGVSKAAGGDFVEAGTQLLPKPLSDPLTAIMESEGVRTNNGVLIYQPDFLESVTRALGIRSMDQVEAQNTAGAGYQANKRISLRRRKRLTRLAVAIANGNQEDYAEAMQDIHEWNRTNPQFAIKGQDIGRLRTTQAKQRANVSRFGVPLSQQLTPAFRRAAGIDNQE